MAGIEKEATNFGKSALTLGISLAVLFGVVWVAGKAWKRSQEA